MVDRSMSSLTYPRQEWLTTATALLPQQVKDCIRLLPGVTNGGWKGRIRATGKRHNLPEGPIISWLERSSSKLHIQISRGVLLSFLSTHNQTCLLIYWIRIYDHNLHRTNTVLYLKGFKLHQILPHRISTLAFFISIKTCLLARLRQQAVFSRTARESAPELFIWPWCRFPKHSVDTALPNSGTEVVGKPDGLVFVGDLPLLPEQPRTRSSPIHEVQWLT